MSVDPNHTSSAGGTSEGAQLSAEEIRLKEAMKQLKLLHVKERLLRDTIPKMLDPLVQKHPTPDLMFKAFMKAANDAQLNVKEFTELMRNEKSQEVFAQADKSRKDSPLGISSWRHKDHPHWFDLDKDDY